MKDFALLWCLSSSQIAVPMSDLHVPRVVCFFLEYRFNRFTTLRRGIVHADSLLLDARLDTRKGASQ